MERLFTVLYTYKGQEYAVEYRCVDKSQARRMFCQEYRNGEEITRIITGGKLLWQKTE